METVLNEIEKSKLSDIEFKIMIVSMLNELSRTTRNYMEATMEPPVNYTNMNKDIETINKNQEEMKNTIFEMKNTVEGIGSRLDEAEDQINKLEKKVGENSQAEPQNKTKQNKFKKNKEGLRELQDNMKCNDIHIIGIPEGEQRSMDRKPV